MMFDRRRRHNKNMQSLFDTARVRGKECGDARVVDVRTICIWHTVLTRTGRPFVCFSLSCCFFLLTLPFSLQ